MLGLTHVRSLAALALIALLAVAAGLWSQNTANGQLCSGPNCVSADTQATLGGGSGANMTIECKWELPDTTAGDLAMTYGQDDTPLVLAGGPICDGATPPPDTRRHMIGILPNQDDDPNQRQYEKWVAVESPGVGDVVDVYWKVWEPYQPYPPNGPDCASPVTFDGVQYCFKYQHHATATKGPPTESNPLGGGGTMFADSLHNCHDLQVAPMTDMFGAAKDTGQMTQAEVDNIIDKCFQGTKAVFRVQEQISKEQPYGEYRVEVIIVNSVGTTFRNVNWFDVVPFIYINRDFNLVDWQTVVNNSTTIVSGDLTMEPLGPARADGSGVEPTIENTGNQEMYVSVHFNPLVLQGDPTKSILRFDSKFRAVWRTDPSSIQVFDPQYASQWRCFSRHPLGSDQTGKLDLSVHPENAQAGTYIGSIDIVGAADCPE